MSGPTPATLRFGARLRDLRVAAGLEQEQIAAAIGRRQPTVSRIEAGRFKHAPAAAVLQAWARACGLDAAAAAELISSAQATETWAYDDQLRGGLAAQQRKVALDEAAVSTIRTLETYMVPGLLETAAYVRHVMVYGQSRALDAADADAAVKARMDRQAILYDDTKTLRFVVAEEALRRRVAPSHVLAGQLDRILALLDLPNVTIGLIATDDPVTVLASPGFTVYGDPDSDDEAWAQTDAGPEQVIVKNPAKVRWLLDLFDAAMGQARVGDAARDVLRGLVEHLRDA